MDLWQKVVFPMKRAWIAVAARVKARKTGGGLLKLHDDVQTCGYQDVQVMWEMLRRSEMETSHVNLKRKRPLWRGFMWPSASRTSACGRPIQQHHHR